MTIINKSLAKVKCLMIGITIDKIFLFFLKSCFVFFIFLLAIFLSFLPFLLPFLILLLLFLSLLIPLLSFLLFTSIFLFSLILPLNFFIDPFYIAKKVLLIFVIIDGSSVLVHIVINSVLKLVSLFFQGF